MNGWNPHFGRRFRAALAAALSAGLVAFALSVPAAAAPVCAPPAEGVSIEAACGGRIFAEPLGSATFIQLESGEYLSGIEALEDLFPRYAKVRSLAEILDDPTAVSEGGRDIYVLEITDFEVPEEDKLPVVVSLSVHGLERAGLEGGVRYAEDLVRWATSDPTHELWNGSDATSIGLPVSEVLSNVHLYLGNANPDGWAAGDLQNGGLYARGNENGVDLNRMFPTKGWMKTSGRVLPLTQSEARAWVKFVETIKPKVAADLHGELTSVNNAFADMMFPAGQWHPREQAQEDSLARHMQQNVERYFELNNVVLGDVMAILRDMRPAAYATAYDVVGYDDSGFMGDWFAEQIGAVEMDVEHFLSHTAPNSIWFPPLESAHVAAVRGEIEAMMVEAIVTDDIEVELDLGTVGYLFDPHVVTDSDADGYGTMPNGNALVPPDGVTPQSYSATRMRYFEDLSRFTTEPLRRVAPGRVAAGALEGLDSLVISDNAFPVDEETPGYDPAAMVASLKAWVEGGGNLVLTDGAMTLLVDLGLVLPGSVQMAKYNAGHIDIDDFGHTFTDGLPATASQTFYEVPLGFSVQSSSTSDSPHWWVDKTVWTTAGGTHVAHITNAQRTGLGTISLGDGTVSFIGALLPQPVEYNQHLYGLGDYGVTVTGGHILNQMIAAGK